MLAWAVTFLGLALLGAIFGVIAAGPLGLVVFIIFLIAAIVSYVRHLRAQRDQGPHVP